MGQPLSANSIPPRSSVIGWVLYDLANTTFALGVGSRYFGLWLIEERGGADWQLSAATIAAMLTVIVIGPWVGTISDHRGVRKPYLIASTLVCVTATALLATWGVVPSLVFYAVGTVGFHSGAVVYDALLPDVSIPASAGRISGAGVAVGYLGSALAIGIGAYLLPRAGYEAVFRSLAAAFLIFALPAFIWLRERSRPRSPGPLPGILHSPMTTLRAWKKALRYPDLVRFLVGRFLYTDAVNSIYLFNVIFAKIELGFTNGEIDRLALLGIAFAAFGAALAGRAVDAIGPKRVLNAALYSQLLGLAAAVGASVSGVHALGWLVAVLGGSGVGAAWASDRVLMTRLTPPPLVGEFFGLYATVGRFATVLGPLVWAAATDGMGWSRTAAMALLGVFIIASRIVLQGVREPVATPAASQA